MQLCVTMCTLRIIKLWITMGKLWSCDVLWKKKLNFEKIWYFTKNYGYWCFIENIEIAGTMEKMLTDLLGKLVSFVWWFLSHSEILQSHMHGDVTITGDGLKIVTCTRHSLQFFSTPRFMGYWTSV